VARHRGRFFAYLRTVPPVRNKVPPPETYVVTGQRGKQVY
jgi:hypothetical protein